MENVKRSFLKTITWRIIASLTTMTLVLIFTGKFSLAIGVGIFDFLLKMIFYYAHERIWNKFGYGRK
jgi:uncharacterized membrane protein